MVIVGGGVCDHFVGGGNGCDCGLMALLVAAAMTMMVSLGIFWLVAVVCVVWWNSGGHKLTIKLVNS